MKERTIYVKKTEGKKLRMYQGQWQKQDGIEKPEQREEEGRYRGWSAVKKKKTTTKEVI